MVGTQRLYVWSHDFEWMGEITQKLEEDQAIIQSVRSVMLVVPIRMKEKKTKKEKLEHNHAEMQLFH